MSSKNHSASAVIFGFDFQVNCAIILMLENIRSLKELKLERKEDIELVLDDDSFVLAQAKAVVRPNTDFRNVRKKLESALESLSDNSQKVNKINKLVYITNSINPLKEDYSRSLFLEDNEVRFVDLPRASKKIITDFLKKEKLLLDTSSLSIKRLPFYSEDINERYRTVRNVIGDFLDSVGVSESMRVRLHDTWRLSVFENGSQPEKVILTKKDILWPLIVCLVNTSRFTEEDVNCSGLDESEFAELTSKYEAIINSKCEKFEFVTKVISDYTRLRTNESSPIQFFVENHWDLYSDDFDADAIDKTIRPNLIKVVISNVINSRNKINSVKIKCNL